MIREKHPDLWTDEEFIRTYGETAKADRRGRPHFLGNLQRPCWTGRIPTYLIWCCACQYDPDGGFTVAHEAGYSRRLECRTCRRRYERRLLSRAVGDVLLQPHRQPVFPGILVLGLLALALLLLTLR